MSWLVLHVYCTECSEGAAPDPIALVETEDEARAVVDKIYDDRLIKHPQARFPDWGEVRQPGYLYEWGVTRMASDGGHVIINLDLVKPGCLTRCLPASNVTS